MTVAKPSKSVAQPRALEAQGQRASAQLSKCTPARGSAATAAADPALLGVYVHFPWCLRKCPYCDFLSLASERTAIPHAAYAAAVIAELERRARELPPRRLRSVFFGGGTPSLWEPRELGRVLEAAHRVFSGSEVEVTVECNPSSFDVRRARELMAAGVNRVSLGVQALDAGRLAFLGRLHDAPAALSAVRAALDAGVPRVSADLIFGVADQSPGDAVKEALALAALGVTHLSVYALTIEPGTEFGARMKKNQLPLARDEQVADSFSDLDHALAAVGFEHYEISNYACSGHMAEHNLGYWRGNDYLGLGTGAWGTLSTSDRRIRYRNTPSPERYLSTQWTDASLELGGPGLPQSALEVIAPETALSERILLGLRLAWGLNVAEAARDVGAEAWPRRRARATARLVERGRLARDGDRIWIPRSAWLLADGTIAELM